MKTLVFILVWASALAAPAELARALEASHSQAPSLLPWLLPAGSVDKVRSVCLVAPSAELVTDLVARGHSVSVASPSGALPMGVREVALAAVDTSTFGKVFDQSMALYNALKGEKFDVIVFPAALGYVSLEAKKSALHFADSVLVVSADEMPPTSLEYVPAVTRFMAERSLEQADASYTTNADAVRSLRFENHVSIWNVRGSLISLLESVTAASVSKMMSKPLVTAIVTSYNRPGMLRQAVASLQAQTYQKMEILVVDDGSTDAGMPAVLDELEKAGVRVIRQDNQFLGAARNNGARAAKGELLVFLDDDNIALPTMVATLVEAQSSSTASIVVNAHYLWYAAAEAPAPTSYDNLKVWCPVGPAVLAGYDGNVFGNANFLMQREAFFAMSGFTEDRVGWEDYEFHVKCAIAGVSYALVPEPLMLFRQHKQMEQMSFNTNAVENRKRVQRAYSELLGSQRSDAFGDLAERNTVTSCPNAPLIVNAGQCLANRITVRTTGQTALYGQAVASALLIAVTQEQATTQLTSTDYEFAGVPGPNTGELDYTVTFRDTPTVRNLLQKAGDNVATTITISFDFADVADNSGTATCPVVTVGPDDFNSCRNICFHADTQIEYHGELLTKAQLESHASCRIPHTTLAKGVSIRTSCTPEQPLRLTESHLVYTARGLREARDIKVKDVLFADYKQTHACTVESVEKDSEEQEFFGLNCLDSVVLANNLKTSTFGIVHTLPSLWMKYVGGVFGIERASRWGLAIGQVALRYGVV